MNTQEYWEKGNQEDAQRNLLIAAAAAEEEKIATGRDTSTAQLDRLLVAQVAYYEWETHHHPTSNPSDVYYTEDVAEHEDMGEQLLKFRRVFQGSYYIEKADLCAGMVAFHDGNARKNLAHLAQKRQEATRYIALHPETQAQGEASLQRLEAGIALSRHTAANWLRTQANCLDMPTARPTVQPPHSSENI